MVKREKKDEKEKLYNQYHPAFCSAMELELREDKEHLIFYREYNLNSKPNKIDLLVIRRNEDCRLKSSLGAIFRKYNICEYKRPKDSLDDITYYRSMGYAYLSVAYNKNISGIDEVTLSFIRASYPRNLIAWFADTGFNISEYDKGIYYITRDYHVDMQIIVTGQLGEEYKWINKLTTKLEAKDLIMMNEELKTYDDKIDIVNAESVIDLGLSLNKNKNSVKELIGMGWFIEEREKLRKEQEKLSEEQEKLSEEQEKLSEEQEKLSEEQEKLSEEQEKLSEEQEKLSEEQEKLTELRTRFTEQKSKLIEREAYLREKEADIKDREAEIKEREEMQAENRKLHKEIELLNKKIRDLTSRSALF